MAKQIVLHGESVESTLRKGREVVAMKAGNGKITAAIVLEFPPDSSVDVDWLTEDPSASFIVTIERMEN